MPGPDSVGNPSVLNVDSRDNVGTIAGTADGLGVQGGTLAFNNLTDSMTGFDHMDKISAAGWLGSVPADAITVNHGIDNLQAEGVEANLNTTLQFASTDPDSNVNIGDGGITQTMTLGNVGSFADTGNINTIQIVSLNGALALNAAVTANVFALAQAQGGSINARNRDVTAFREHAGLRR